ncbi:DUF1501 domain-containing protein [Thalassoroseus pseudoceratinae]|uniref:DUF1501 domain-containing protein n=1 Tax=Thalassoroseus pseudoceratinae TaxID=2713176 RepID=UPI00141E55FE|nr:DUF1501 domain-containing protein [Thalassoroseus pseudoceratinae]
MTHSPHAASHAQQVARSPFAPAARDLIRVGGSRRWFLQTGLAGMAGLSLPSVLRQAAASPTGTPKKSVILFWLSGGPSQIDMWDPKPDAPVEIRSPFGDIATKIPGVRFSEHMPLQASIADRLSVIRSVDTTASNHTPITMQAGNPLARRTNDGKDGAGYPSMGSIAAKFRGSNNPNMPAFVGLADSWAADVYGAGMMGSDFEPVKGMELAGKFAMPKGVSVDRLQDRAGLRRQFDRLQKDLDQSNTLAQSDRFTQQAVDMVLSGKVQEAFSLDDESAELKERYGQTSVGQKALLARRLVENGVSFVLVSGAWGYFDHHGDNVRWGGIEKGLKPLLPRVDRAMYGLVTDLEERGLLDETLVLMMGEFGRSPRINNELGRDHWTPVMSMLAAGGGLNHGQAIGSTDRQGGAIQSRAVRPQDLAATVFQHLDIDLQSHWTNPQGRPIPIVEEGGQPISELF